MRCALSEEHQRLDRLVSQEVAIARHHLGFCQLLLTLQGEGGREGREGGEGGRGGRGGRGGGEGGRGV